VSRSTNEGPTGAASTVSEQPEKARQEADTRELAAAPRNRSGQRSARLAIACAIAALAVAALVLARRLTEPTPTPGPLPPAVKQKAAPSPALPPPAPIQSVEATGDGQQLVARFDVPLERALAETPASYAIEPAVKIHAAELAEDGRTVTLTTAPLEEGTTYVLSAPGVRCVPLESNRAAFRYVDDRRTLRGLLVLYRFEEGEGTVVHDLCELGEPLHLEIRDPEAVEWRRGSLVVKASTLIAAERPAAKITTACRKSNAITIEAWIRPGNTTQGGPSRIVTLSRNPLERNFTLGQEGDGYDVRLRTTATGSNGSAPSFHARHCLAPRLTHVVYTRDADGTASLYLNGSRASAGPIRGDLSNWGDGMRLGLANEVIDDRTWLGELHLVAVYGRALSAEEVARHFDAGPGGDNPPR
jgi:hypothetical protein